MKKHILLNLYYFSILGVENRKYGRQFMVTSAAGHTALLPLLHPTELTPIKIVVSITSLLLSQYLLSKLFKPSSLLKLPELCYISVLPIITIYETVLHKIVFVDKMPFLPLMLTSIYCSLGLIYSFLYCYYDFFSNDSEIVESSKKNLAGLENEETESKRKLNEKIKKLSSKKQS